MTHSSCMIRTPRAWNGRPLVIAMVVIAMVLSAVPTGGSTDDRATPVAEPPAAVWSEVAFMDAIVEVEPGAVEVLCINTSTNGLEPEAWDDPIASMTGDDKRAVDSVEPWLRRDLAIQLRRLGGDSERFARLIIQCPDERWVDEIVFSVAHTPVQVLRQVGQASVLQDNAEQLYTQDQYIGYANLVERQGPDGNYTTIEYVNYTGTDLELPADIYYWYVAHARVFWEAPAKVSGKSFWRKAYFDEVTHEDSNTLRSRLAGCNNIIEGINASTVWMQMNMEFGYGTNPLQPVEVILSQYGSCGQYSITTASSLKVAMVPARVAIYPASDHQWCEVWHDGAWRHLDASNDVAGAANVKQPELVRRTNSVNYNDGGVFERSGWKPYMSATSTFRPDDRVFNSIDISPMGPSFSLRESGMTETSHPEPCQYTATSTVHLTVNDAGGDPIEGAYVGVYRVGHYVYDSSQKDYPHFATANYTNATGQCDFELGLQGHCNVCGKSHTYAALILSEYYEGTNDFFEMQVPEEDQEYSYTFTARGDAPRTTDGQANVHIWQGISTHRVSLELGVEGLQRHTHGGYGQYEQFGSGTSFDHTFPATIDAMLMTREELDVFLSGGVGAAVLSKLGAERLQWDSIPLPDGEPCFLVLSNRGSYASTKVVSLSINLTAKCYPRLTMDGPVAVSDHSTDDPLVVNGTLWDHVPVVGLECSIDNGTTWTDISSSLDLDNGTYHVLMDVAHLPSGELTVVVRATDSLGIWREREAMVYLDADDPVLVLDTPSEGAILPWAADVMVSGTVTDNRAVSGARARLLRASTWTDLEVDPVTGAFNGTVDTGSASGVKTVEFQAWDGVGRRLSVSRTFIHDSTEPILEIRSPSITKAVTLGDVDELEIEGSMWDDQGIAVLRYQVDDGDWTVDHSIILANGSFSLTVPVDDWEDGEHDVIIELVDQAGNIDGKTVTIILDTTPPTIAHDVLQAIYDDGDLIALSGRVTDTGGVENLWITVDGGAEVSVGFDSDGGFYNTLPSGPEAVGHHTVLVRALDSLENLGEILLVYSVVDETRPELRVDAPSMGDKVPRGQRITVMGIASDNVRVVELWLNVADGGYVNITFTLDPVFDEWVTEVETQNMDLGAVIIDLRVRDGSGNEEVASVSVTLVDRTKPEFTLESLPGESLSVQKGGDLDVTGTATDDVGVTKVYYRLDGLIWISAPPMLVGAALTVTVPTEGLSTGTHFLDIKVTDAAGNEKVVSTTFAIEEEQEGGGATLVIAAAVVAAVIVIALLVVRFMPRTKDGEPETDAEPSTGSGIEVEPELEPEPEIELEADPEVGPEPDPEAEDMPTDSKAEVKDA